MSRGTQSRRAGQSNGKQAPLAGAGWAGVGDGMGGTGGSRRRSRRGVFGFVIEVEGRTGSGRQVQREDDRERLGFVASEGVEEKDSRNAGLELGLELERSAQGSRIRQVTSRKSQVAGRRLQVPRS